MATLGIKIKIMPESLDTDLEAIKEEGTKAISAKKKGWQRIRSSCSLLATLGTYCVVSHFTHNHRTPAQLFILVRFNYASRLLRGENGQSTCGSERVETRVLFRDSPSEAAWIIV